MIKIECGNCRHDLNTGELVFCEDCVKKLESQIEKLEDENYKLTTKLTSLTDES